ncbi:MAG: hypothetical protein Q4F41_13130 [Eubacteriales bacterium]|nr:hypothetical protein [Eubacteriales bacterium]
MSRELEELYREGEERGVEIGKMKKAEEAALNLAERGMSVADIAEIVKVRVSLVQEWLAGKANLAR